MKWAGLAAAALLVAACVFVYVSAETRPAPAAEITLAWLADHQNPDGSWGDVPAPLGQGKVGRTGITSLALLAFFESGYCHLSKDRLGGRVAKDVVWAAIEWLRRDGAVASGPDPLLELALAAAAHGEAYDMTCSSLMKEDAQRSLDALAAKQAVDGSWGSPEATAFAVLALRSARRGELPFDPRVLSRLQAYYDARPADAAETIGRRTFSRATATPPAKLPDAYEPDYLGWHQATLAILLFEGHQSPGWERWSEPLHRALRRTQAADGLWHGSTLSETVVQTSLALATQDMYRRGLHGQGAPAQKKRFPWP